MYLKYPKKILLTMHNGPIQQNKSDCIIVIVALICSSQ